MHMRSYIGDRSFYSRVLTIAIPIMIQQGITNFVGMLDNIMVGRLGTDPMSGVSIINQLLFVFNLCIFGGLSGIGIFTAQFYGKGDEKGIRYTFRMQILLAFLLTAACTVLFFFRGEQLISLYLHEGGSSGDIAETLRQARRYLAVMYAGMLPFAVNQAYASTLRNTGETLLPMKAGITAVAVNLIGNYILIYGKFGAPALGVAGAAAATVLSRFVELVIVAGWTHRHAEQKTYIIGAYRKLFSIPGDLIRRILPKAIPLLLNETLWAGGMAALVQCYSVRGLSAVAAMNISSTISNVFNISFLAMGNAIAILLGQILGGGHLERAKEEARKLTAFSVAICIVTGFLLFLTAGIFPLVYKTSEEIRATAASLIRICGLCMPLYAYANATYFILRSGGKTGITFLFDSCFVWVVYIPVAFILANFTSLPPVRMFLIVELLNVLKCILGFFMVRTGIWAQDLTEYAD